MPGAHDHVRVGLRPGRARPAPAAPWSGWRGSCVAPRPRRRSAASPTGRVRPRAPARPAGRARARRAPARPSSGRSSSSVSPRRRRRPPPVAPISAGRPRAARAASATAASRAAPGLGLGQRPVGRPEPQREGQRLPARRRPARRSRRRRAAPTPAARPRPRAASSASAPAGQVGVHDQRDVLLGHRVRREASAPVTTAGACRDQQVEVDLDGAGAGGDAVRRQTAGCSSPAWPSSTPADPELARSGRGATGCRGSPAPPRRRPAGRRADLADHLDGVGPGRRAARRPTSRRPAASPASTTASVSGWRGTAASSLSSSASSGRQSTPRIGALSRSGVGKNTGAVS